MDHRGHHEHANRGDDNDDSVKFVDDNRGDDNDDSIKFVNDEVVHAVNDTDVNIVDNPQDSESATGCCQASTTETRNPNRVIIVAF